MFIVGMKYLCTSRIFMNTSLKKDIINIIVLKFYRSEPVGLSRFHPNHKLWTLNISSIYYINFFPGITIVFFWPTVRKKCSSVQEKLNILTWKATFFLESSKLILDQKSWNYITQFGNDKWATIFTYWSVYTSVVWRERKINKFWAPSFPLKSGPSISLQWEHAWMETIFCVKENFKAHEIQFVMQHSI